MLWKKKAKVKVNELASQEIKMRCVDCTSKLAAFRCRHCGSDLCVDCEAENCGYCQACTTPKPMMTYILSFATAVKRDLAYSQIVQLIELWFYEGLIPHGFDALAIQVEELDIEMMERLLMLSPAHFCAWPTSKMSGLTAIVEPYPSYRRIEMYSRKF